MKMSHPNLPGAVVDVGGRTARQYARRGWEPVTAESLVAGNTRDELDELASDEGIDPSGYPTKAVLAVSPRRRRGLTRPPGDRRDHHEPR